MPLPIEPSYALVSYGVPRWSPDWAIPEVPVPESATHDSALDYLKALLLAWVARSGRSILVARDLGIRWVEEEPRFGFDPDLCLIEPTPPEFDTKTLTSLRLWEPGHTPPRLAIEVVSPGHPYKDYVDTPARCAACGVEELWIYDPMRAGPKREGGPLLIQIWRREGSAFLRVYAGKGPAHSEYLDAWLHPEAGLVPRNAKLRISGAEDGSAPWLTEVETEKALRELAEQRRMTERRRREAAERWHQTAEQQRQAAEQQRQAAEQQRDTEQQRREAAERDLTAARTRMAELEAELARRG